MAKDGGTAFFAYVLLNRARNVLRVADARRKGAVACHDVLLLTAAVRSSA